MAVKVGAIALLSVLSGLLAYFASDIYGANNALPRILLATAFSLFFALFLISIMSSRLSMLLTVFALYHLFFFLLPGMIHLAQNLFPFYEASYGDETTLPVSWLVLLYALSAFLGVCVSLSRRETGSAPVTFTRGVVPRDKDLLVGVVSLIAVSIPCIAMTGIWIGRRAEAFGGDAEPSPLSQILEALPSSGMFLCAILAFYLMRRRSFFSIVLFAVTAGLAFLVNYPLALTRFVLFQRLIVLLYLLFDLSRVRLKVCFGILAVLSIFTVFPAIDSLSRGESGELELDPLTYVAHSGDLDGLQSTLNVYQMVESKGISWGWQLLSTLLSFVPREIWPQKAYSTGTTAAAFAGYTFTNLSAPLISEIYVDFGAVGVAIIPFLVGWLVVSLDLGAATVGRERGHLLEKFFFGGIMGFETIILRGSLESIISQVYLYGLLIWMLLIICQRRGRGTMPFSEVSMRSAR